MIEVNKAVEIFQQNGIQASIDNNNMIVISHYAQPNGTTFEELGINENELIENVTMCDGVFDTRNSKLTTFPLYVSREIRLHEDTKITEMPNLKAVGILVTNKHLKRLPRLKHISSASFEESPVKSLPKLKKAGILIFQNSAIQELPSLETVGRLCIIDCPFENLNELKYAGDVFICSSDENKRINIQTLSQLEEIDKIFVANSNLKSIPKLKTAQKIALYNCEIKTFKQIPGAEIETGNQISDEELAEKFDNFTDWYNSQILEQSMNVLGDLVKEIGV